MQEFWATAKLHHTSIHFKIDTKKSVLNLEAFREMLHISPRIPNQPFADLPTEEEVLDFLRDFQVTADVPEIYMQEFWAIAKLHHHSIRFKIDTRKSVLDLEAFREMLHISPRIPNQPFADLPTEEEVLEFLRFLGHSHDIHYLTDAKALELTVSDCLKLKCFGDSITESTLILPILSGRTLCISLPSQDAIEFIGITFEKTHCSQLLSKAYQEYYACAMGEAVPKLKASARKKKGDYASSTTPPTPTPTTTAESLRAKTPVEPTDLQRTKAEQLKIVLKRSRQENHISQQSGSGTGEGTGSKPGVPDVPSDDSEEELSWKSSDDEEVGSHEESKESDVDSDDGSDKDSDETVKSGAGKD
nr:hypothetical protein [Tanacetum cinerariifolium]